MPWNPSGNIRGPKGDRGEGFLDYWDGTGSYARPATTSRVLLVHPEGTVAPYGGTLTGGAGLVTGYDFDAEIGTGTGTPAPAPEPGVFRAREYGMVSGATGGAVATAIQAAVDAASAAGGGVVLLPVGSYPITVPSGGSPSNPLVALKDKVSVAVNGTGTCELVLSGSPQSIFRANNTPPPFSGGIKLTANVSSATVEPVIAVTSTSGFKAGDYLLLGDDRDMGTLTAGRYTGEWVRVKSVNSSTSMTLYGRTAYDYSTANNCRLWAYNLWTGVGITGVTMRHENRVRDASRTEMITMIGVRELEIEDVEIRDGGGPGIGLHYCVDFNIDNVSITNLRDWEDDGSKWYGYGIHLSSGVENGTISASRFRQMRHAITTTGYDGHVGEPRGILVTGCVATECTLAAFDTHAEGDNFTFSSCHVHDTSHDAFVLRCRNGRVIGCTVDGALRGVLIPEQRVTNAVVQGNSFTNIVAHGVEIVWWGVGRIRIVGNLFEGLGRCGVAVPAGVARLTIMRNTFLNCGTDASSFTEAIRFHGGAQLASIPSSSVRTSDVQISHNEFGQDVGSTSMTHAVRATTDARVNEISFVQNFGHRLPTTWIDLANAAVTRIAANDLATF